MPKIIIKNQEILLSFLIFLFPFSATIYAQQNKPSNSDGKNISVNRLPAPVASDGCTMWFDGDYKDCCFRHDADYARGSDNWRTRLRADNRLFICIAAKEGAWHFALAPVMWTAVRIFGSDWSPSSRKNTVHRFSKRMFILLKKSR